jgi:hypothetical protein
LFLSGDLPDAWQPSQDGDYLKQSMTLSFETPVYLTTVDVYEVWHPGGVVRIWLYNEEAEEFELGWEGESLMALLNPDPLKTSAMVITRTVCPKIFPVRTIKWAFCIFVRYFLPLHLANCKFLHDTYLLNLFSHIIL